MRRLESINKILLQQLDDNIELCTHSSTQLDESTDMTDTARMNGFIRLVFKDMTSEEELFDTLLSKGSTSVQGVCTSFENSSTEHLVPLNKFVAITTDTAATMVGKKIGFVALCGKDLDFPSFASFRCLIHRVSSSTKAVKINHVVGVVEMVGLMKARPLQDRLFLKHLEEESELKFADLSSPNEGRSLSLGKALLRFLELLPHVEEFSRPKIGVRRIWKTLNRYRVYIPWQT